MINAAISAAYYLRIVGTMFLRGGSGDDAIADEPIATPYMPGRSRSACFLSVFGTIILGHDRAGDAVAGEPGDGRGAARTDSGGTGAAPFCDCVSVNVSIHSLSFR
jgi:hypothetical protein